jgi:tRNA U34 5-carboxymethylaminomethyl modifying GTPase MnmE/TrmE
MKIHYIFDSIDDKDDNKIFSQAMKMHSALYELEQELRAVCKYKNPTQRDVFWSERFYEILKENEVELI